MRIRLTPWPLAALGMLAGMGSLAAQDRPAQPRFTRPMRQLTPEGRDFLKQAPLTRGLLQPPGVALPAYTMPVQVKDPADYPIAVTRGKDATFPIRIIRPQAVPETPGDGSTPPLVVPLPAPRRGD